MLSERLKELEAEQLVERRVIPETPVRVEYRLTAAGEALGTVLDAVAHWADTWIAVSDAPDATAALGNPPLPEPPRRSRRARVSGSV